MRTTDAWTYRVVVLTDREPFEYRYLSGRLLTALLQHDEATRRRWKIHGEIKTPLAAIQVSRAELDHTNMHALAARARQLVTDHTGDLGYVGGAHYIEDQLNLRHGIFPSLYGWRGEVACYSGEVTTAGNERVFLALFGSASNVVGYCAGGGSGYYPSDITGLYTMLDAAREPDDPEIEFGHRWEDGGLDNEYRAYAAIKQARGGARSNIGVHDFLAQVFLEVSNFRYDDHFTGRVIIGTPLWVATPRPTPGRGPTLNG